MPQVPYIAVNYEVLPRSAYPTGDVSSQAAQMDPDDPYGGDGLPTIQQQAGENLRALLRRHEVDGLDGPYVPEPLLRRIFSRERIQQELELPGYNIEAPTIQEYLDHIDPVPGSEAAGKTKRSPCLKIFALLILVQCPNRFGDFLQRGVSDEHLPFALSRSGRVTSVKDPEKALDFFYNWSELEKEVFVSNQWQYLVQYFDLIVGHERSNLITLNNSARRPWCYATKTQTVQDLNDKAGGFGRVNCVKIHPQCHGFAPALEKIHFSGSDFVVKTLLEISYNDYETFLRELQSLRTWNGLHVHPHLVTVLSAFTYEQRTAEKGNWNFIFPKADGDLDEYFEHINPEPRCDRDLVCWISKQLDGIMGALVTIHEPKHLLEDKYGRHGDIKGDNVLLFRTVSRGKEKPAEYILVLSDFGLTALNSKNSRSNIPNKKIPAAPGYRPPESDIEGGKISRAFDVWTTGCMFLEFVTWMLGGWSLLSRFMIERHVQFITGIKNTFFVIEKLENSDTTVVSVNPKVVDWMYELRRHPNSTRFTLDLLDMVEDNMLVILETRDSRASAIALKRELERMKNLCHEDPSYGTDPISGKTELKRRKSIKRFKAKLNEEANKALQLSRVKLHTYTGTNIGTSLTPEGYRNLDSRGPDIGE